MNKTINIEGNKFVYTVQKINEYNEHWYVGVVFLLNGCTAHGKTLKELEINLTLAIRAWLDGQAPITHQKQLKNIQARAESSGAIFFYECAKKQPIKYIEEGFNNWYKESLDNDIAFNNAHYEANLAWHAGFQYAIKPMRDVTKIAETLGECGNA